MSNQNFLTGKQLLNLKVPIDQHLIEPIMRKTGTGLIVGVPDTGKSQFVRQLALSIVNGEQKFLGFNLCPVHKKVVFVVTEDDKYSTKDALSKQVGNNHAKTGELRFIFAEDMDTKAIIKHLDQTLKQFPSDLVIIDAFGDVFQGLDSNNNMAMRNSIAPFTKIAKEHDTFILFVHHVNKASYNETPNQKSIQGGSGLVQKVRLAMQLSKGPDDVRYLSVIKGNHVAREHKDQAYELIFDETTLTYSNTGNRILNDQIGENNKRVKTKNKISNHEEWLNKVFLDVIELSYTELIQRLTIVSSKSENTVKNHLLKSLLESDLLIKKDDGKYSRL
jgi:RecA-family ATPase